MNIDFDTWDLIESMAPNHEAIGSFLSRLVHAEYARRQERMLPREVVAVCGDEVTHAAP